MYKFFAISVFFITMLLPIGLSAGQRLDASELFGLVRDGQYDAARQQLSQANATPFDAVWLEAEIAFSRRDYDRAELLYKKLADSAPDQDHFRRRLVETYLGQKRYNAAQLENLKLQLKNKDPRWDSVYTNVAANIRAQRPYGLGFYFDMSPSNNINDASETGKSVGLFGQEYENPDELKPQFGWKTSVGASAFYKHEITDKSEIRFDLNFGYNHYTVDTLDNSFVSASIGWRQQISNFEFSIGGKLQRSFGDGEQYAAVFGTVPSARLIDVNENYTTIGVTTALKYKFSEKTSAEISGSISHFDYDDQEFEYKNGQQILAALGLSHALSQSSLISGFVRANNYEEPGGRGDWQGHRNYDTFTVGASYVQGWQNGLIASVGVERGWTTYGADYPFTDVTRQDDLWMVRGEIVNKRWNFLGIAPKLSCSYSAIDSNIDQFDRTATGCGVSMQTQF